MLFREVVFDGVDGAQVEGGGEVGLTKVDEDWVAAEIADVDNEEEDVPLLWLVVCIAPKLVSSCIRCVTCSWLAMSSILIRLATDDVEVVFVCALVLLAAVALSLS